MAAPDTKLPMASPDVNADRLKRLREIFPEAFTEGKIDLKKLPALLGAAAADAPELYGLSWTGKSEAIKNIQTPTTGTLLPATAESVNFAATENLIIEGDNLEVLKLLQGGYHGRVKMIYIDPPYNTGGDFIYPDNYKEGLADYLKFSGQVSGEGVKLTTNPETDGRYHSKWLTMIYPRLFLARNLLREDGVIFVSIDDHEVHNLRAVMNEIFGEENFCATFVWNPEGNTDNQYQIKVNHEYILAYYKSASFAGVAIGHVVDPSTPKESNLWKGIADNNVNKNNPENPPSIIELPIGFPCSEKELFYAKKAVDEKFFARTKADGYVSDRVKDEYDIEHKSGLPIKLDDLVVKDYKLTQPCRIYGGMANRNKLIEFIKNTC